MVEAVIVVLILSLLGAIVFANVGAAMGYGRPSQLAEQVLVVRDMIHDRTLANDVELAVSGYPATVEGLWFEDGAMPVHSWTGTPMIVETVKARSVDVYPPVKTFDPEERSASNAWYNASNGSFCALVVDSGDEDADLETFNTVNAANASSIDQTVE